MEVTNKYHKFDLNDVLNCSDFSKLCDYSVKNRHTIASLEVRLMEEYKDDQNNSRKKALVLLQCLQHAIETKMQEIKFNKRKWF